MRADVLRDSATGIADADMQKIAALDKNHHFIDGKAFAYGDYTPENIFM